MQDSAGDGGRVIRFGVFEADLDSGELRRRGARVRLQERPFRILATLLSRPNEVVTRQQLREMLWAADTFVDFDHGLDAAVNKLREALGDSAANPRFIETLPRRGYRFLAPPNAASVIPPIEDRRRRLAVLPFANATADPANEPFCEGLTQEMIIRLGSLLRNSVGVIASNSVARYRDQDRSADRVGRELGVDWVLDGTLRRMNGRVRIGAQLVEVAGRTLLWADTWEGDATDEFTLQREIAIQAAGSLAREVLPQHADAAVVAPASVPRCRKRHFAMQHWLHARTHEGFRNALLHFRDAVPENTECAVCLSGLAQMYVLGLQYGLFRPDEAIPAAKRLALRALEVDPMVSNGHLILGFIRHRTEYDWDGAETSYLYARQLNPSCVDTLHNYATLLSHLGRNDEAIAAIRLARRLNPYALVLGAEECCILVNAGRPAEGLTAVAAVQEIDPEYPIAHNSRARALLVLDRPAEAFDAAERGLARGADIPAIIATRGVAAARSGRPGIARDALTALASNDLGSYVSRVHVARLHAALGETDHAVARLGEGYERRDAEMTELACEPEWNGIRAHPGFQALVAKWGITC